jgi:hypothetical protein
MGEHSLRMMQLEDDFAAQHGCQPLKPWKSNLPFGLDLLLKAFKHARTQTILQFFLEVVEESGNTFQQSLLGARGVNTVEPENIEAVLSKQFAGTTFRYLSWSMRN